MGSVEPGAVWCGSSGSDGKGVVSSHRVRLGSHVMVRKGLVKNGSQRFGRFWQSWKDADACVAMRWGKAVTARSGPFR